MALPPVVSGALWAAGATIVGSGTAWIVVMAFEQIQENRETGTQHTIAVERMATAMGQLADRLDALEASMRESAQIEKRVISLEQRQAVDDAVREVMGTDGGPR